MGKSSLKHGQETKILEILLSIILHHMIKNPQQLFDITEGIPTKHLGEDVCYML